MGRDRRDVPHGGGDHARAVVQPFSARHGQLRRRFETDHLDARVGQPCARRSRSGSVRRQHLLSGAERARLQRASIRHQPVHAADLRGHTQSGPRLQPRVDSVVPADGCFGASAGMAHDARPPRIDCCRPRGGVLLLPHAPGPRAPAHDLELGDPALARCPRPMGGTPHVAFGVARRCRDPAAGARLLVSGGADPRCRSPVFCLADCNGSQRPPAARGVTASRHSRCRHRRCRGVALCTSLPRACGRQSGRGRG